MPCRALAWINQTEQPDSSVTLYPLLSRYYDDIALLIVYSYVVLPSHLRATLDEVLMHIDMLPMSWRRGIPATKPSKTASVPLTRTEGCKPI